MKLTSVFRAAAARLYLWLFGESEVNAFLGPDGRVWRLEVRRRAGVLNPLPSLADTAVPGTIEPLGFKVLRSDKYHRPVEVIDVYTVRYPDAH